MPRKLNKTTSFFLLLLFASSVIRVLLSAFPKSAVTYNDELFYLELAQNLFRHGTLTVYNTPLPFTKLLYSLLLAPFYAVKDSVLRIRLISAFNALLTSSSLVPGYLLSRRVLKKPWQIICCLLLLAVSPNLFFSLTFMAENLYLPLLLWGIYATYRYFASETRSPLRAFLLGLLAFLLFFAKEVGAAYIAAVAVALLADRNGQKKSRKSWFGSLGCYFLGVFVPYILLSLTLFRGTGSIYSLQLSKAVLSDGPHIRFFLAACGRMLLEFGLTALWFPVILPVTRFSKLISPQKSLLLFSLAYILFTAVGTAYAVSLPEEFTSGTILTNQRYNIGILFPFLLLFFAACESTPKKNSKPLLWLTLLFAGLTAAFFTFPSFGSLVSSPLLYFTKALKASAQSTLWLWLFRAGLPLLFLLGLLLLRKKQALACLLVPALFAFGLASNIFFVRDITREERIQDPALLTEARLLDAWLDSAQGNTLVVAESSHDPSLRLFNTLLDDEYYFVPSSHFRNLAEAGTSAIDLKKEKLPGPFRGLTGLGYDSLQEIDQIILLGDTSLLDPDSVEDITPEGIRSLKILRPKDSSVLSVRDPAAYVPGETIRFSGAGLSFRSFSPVGFSNTEASFTWTKGTEASLTLKPKTGTARDLEAAWKWQMTVGSQPCKVYANGTLIFDDTVTTEEGIAYFSIPADAWAGTGILTLRFEFPEARQPGPQDTRLLAVAFVSLTLTEE